MIKKVFALRHPLLWGEDEAGASDGSRFASWRQHGMTEWRARSKGSGVLVSWHVETPAGCLYAPLRTVSSSAVAAMIEGVLRHDPERRVETHGVEAPGQSDVALALCHVLGGVRLMPRVKRSHSARLDGPAAGRPSSPTVRAG